MRKEEIKASREVIANAKYKLKLAIEVLDKAAALDDATLGKMYSTIGDIEDELEGPDQGVLYQVLCELDYEIYKSKNNN